MSAAPDNLVQYAASLRDRANELEDEIAKLRAHRNDELVEQLAQQSALVKLTNAVRTYRAAMAACDAAHRNHPEQADVAQQARALVKSARAAMYALIEEK